MSINITKNKFHSSKNIFSFNTKQFKVFITYLRVQLKCKI